MRLYYFDALKAKVQGGNMYEYSKRSEKMCETVESYVKENTYAIANRLIEDSYLTDEKIAEYTNIPVAKVKELRASHNNKYDAYTFANKLIKDSYLTDEEIAKYANIPITEVKELRIEQANRSNKV